MEAENTWVRCQGLEMDRVGSASWGQRSRLEVMTRFCNFIEGMVVCFEEELNATELHSLKRSRLCNASLEKKYKQHHVVSKYKHRLHIITRFEYKCNLFAERII